MKVFIHNFSKVLTKCQQRPRDILTSSINSKVTTTKHDSIQMTGLRFQTRIKLVIPVRNDQQVCKAVSQSYPIGDNLRSDAKQFVVTPVRRNKNAAKSGPDDRLRGRRFSTCLTGLTAVSPSITREFKLHPLGSSFTTFYKSFR